MSHDVGITPDLVQLVYHHVLRLFPAEDADMVHKIALPDGYNAATDGLAIVVADDVTQVDETTHTRELVRISVYGPDREGIRALGRRLYTAMTQGITGIGLGVSRSKSTFFGTGPSYQPTGFVSTMSISVGVGKLLATIKPPTA